jgi:hypothetical protein
VASDPLVVEDNIRLMDANAQQAEEIVRQADTITSLYRRRDEQNRELNAYHDGAPWIACR